MALQAHSVHDDSIDEATAERLAVLYPDWGERLITIVAATLAIVIVAVIAVVMGMT